MSKPDNKYEPTSAAFIKSCFADGSRAILNTVDGEYWISNSYFAAPITRQFAGFTRAYKVGLEPAIWQVDRSVYLSTADPPDLNKIIPADLAKVHDHPDWAEAVPLEVDHVGGWLFTNPDAPALILQVGSAVSNSSTTVVAANRDYLRALVGGMDVARNSDRQIGCQVRPHATGPTERRRVRLYQQVGKPLTMLAVVVEHESYVSSQEPGKSGNVWLEDFRAILMPVRVS
ncbi:MAG: hypothetical protein V4472_25080 [Pseudomonadota bacterium]